MATSLHIRAPGLSSSVSTITNSNGANSGESLTKTQAPTGASTVVGPEEEGIRTMITGNAAYLVGLEKRRLYLEKT
jgi:hypothetical protein